MAHIDPIVLDREPKLGEVVSVFGPALSCLRSWSPRIGSAVTLLSPSRSFRARVIALEKDRAELFVYEQMTGNAESSLEIVLLQALPDKERMEQIIEKVTELGADVIVPWRAKKGIDLAEREAQQKKAHRWPERAKRAARQCRRAKVPLIAPFTDFSSALQYGFVKEADLKVALWEKADRPLREVLGGSPGVRSICLLIGPEGGLSEEEIEMARGAGFISASFGVRILRTETAAIIAVALVQYALGDLG
jgi:16S rRNA (uracil1498-N3)-methyltransferase